MTIRLTVLFPPLRSWRSSLALGLLAPLFLVTAAQAQDPLDEMRSLAHSRLPVQLLLNQGMTLLYGPASQALENSDSDGLEAFGAAAGGRQEVSRAGHTKVDGFSFLAGLGRRASIEDSPLAAFSYGFFAEGGTGDIETRQTFDNGTTTRSEGRGRYVGGGFLLKTEFQNRIHMNGAFRVGQAAASLKTLDGAVDPPDSSGVYFSAGGGLGWQAFLMDQLELDVYGRLLWSRQGAGEKRVIAGQGLVGVSAVNSTRTNLGARADFQAGGGRVIYVGAAWEHEFNGRAELAAGSRTLPGPFADLEGDSLIGEVGLKLAGEDGLSASFGLDGSWGRREALGGVLRLGYEF